MSQILRKKNSQKISYQKICENNHSYYDSPKVQPKKIKQKIKQKRKVRVKKSYNFVKIVSLLFLSLYGYYVCPYVYKEFFKPIILNRLLNRNIKFDLTELAYPSRYYLHNSYLLDRYLVVPPANSSKELSKIQITSELTDTKNKVIELFKKYPNLNPSLFVWEYSTGNGFEINSDEIYPSASIIKIPIVFELMRQIDSSEKTSNPIKLTDKMVFNEDFRTTGSGNLQKTKEGISYTLDYLANIMISESDNSATNMLLYKTGGMNNFNRFTRNIGLKATSMGQWLPDIEGYNKTTTREISNILYNIDNPAFINPKYKNIIKEYLGNTKNTHLLKEKLPEDVMVLHKTGDIGKMLGDSGIIYTQNGKKYIISIMVKRPHNDNSAKTLIQDASLLIYNDINSMQ